YCPHAAVDAPRRRARRIADGADNGQQHRRAVLGQYLAGSTGIGKSWLACALGHKACREGFSVLYKRASRPSTARRPAARTSVLPAGCARPGCASRQLSRTSTSAPTAGSTVLSSSSLPAAIGSASIIIFASLDDAGAPALRPPPNGGCPEWRW